ncbi:hypothetical protein [Streptomyces sp. NPDC001816]|uniref:hypothetical protein n=1 Tax=Streptomyces sp. NPDC001816 TaxID=3364612 RepID=UPI00369669E7
MAYARALFLAERAHGVTVGDGAAAARLAVEDSVKAMLFQQSLLRLSVSPTEAATADSLTEQVLAVVVCLNQWWEAVLHGRPGVDHAERRLTMRANDLIGTIEHVVQTARGWLDVSPDVDRPRRSLWRRLREAYLDWRLRDVQG